MTFDWKYTFSLLGDVDFWKACVIVAELSVSAWLVAGAIGFLLALAKQSRIVLLRWPARTYIWFFRSLPLLVLLVFVYNLPQIFPPSRPLVGDAFKAGLISMILSEAAYMAEIHRGGLLSVPRGQYEAAKALGIRYVGIQRLIVVPQAIRIAMPTLGNEFVTIIKLVSLVSVISLAEILLVGERLYVQNFKIFEALVAVAFYYVLVVTIFSNLVTFLETSLDIRKRKIKPLEISVELEAQIDSLSRGMAATKERTDGASLPMIEARGLVKAHGALRALDGVDLTVQRGDVISIIGPSGSGKTSLLRALNGLEVVDQGRVMLNGRYFLGEALSRDDVSDPRQIEDVGMVFQSFNLFPLRTVLENVMLAPRYHKRGMVPALRVEALALLEKVGLLEHANKYPHQLSGGQQQRVAIARALAMKPSIMLFDEPTSALDPELVNEVLSVLEQLAREGMTMLIVTHEMHFAFKISSRIIFIENGKILHDSTPRALLHSSDQRVQSFLHQVSHGLVETASG